MVITQGDIGPVGEVGLAGLIVSEPQLLSPHIFSLWHRERMVQGVKQVCKALMVIR